MVDFKEMAEGLNRYLSPQTYPIAVRMCASEDELPEKTRIPQQDLGITISVCHALAMARRYGWTLAVDKHQSCYAAGISMGLLPLLPEIVDGSLVASLKLWGLTQEQAAKTIEIMPKFEYGKYQYVLMSPLDRAAFEPDCVLFYMNPAQVWVLLSAYLSGLGRRGGLDVTLTTGSGCTNMITRTILTDEAQFGLIGTGERLVPHTQDHECSFSIPMSKMESTLKGLETGYRSGVFRYPVPTFLRYDSQHPPGYDKMRAHLLGED